MSTGTEFPFKTIGSAVLERIPIIMPELDPWRNEYLKLKWNHLVEERNLRIAEVEKTLDQKVAEFQSKEKSKQTAKEKGKKKGVKEEEVIEQVEEPIKTSKAKESQEAQKKGSQRVLYPRITPDDISNNRRSLYRQLDKTLYLIVKKEQDQKWHFPQGVFQYEKDGVSLRKTAKRFLGEECGKNLDAWFVGNGPMGYWTYPNKSYTYSRDLNDKYDLTKVFYFKAQYLFGPVKLNRKSGLVDFVWVTRDELKEYLTDSQHYNYVREFLR